MRSEIFATGADVRTWLPGDIIYEDKLYLPHDMPEGEYELAVAIVDPVSYKPKIKLAIKGMETDGWYTMGKIKCNKNVMWKRSENKFP